MPNIFDINTTLFTLWGYQMSYLEFFGTVANIWCVWLTAKNKILCWPIGIIGVIFYLFLFYQIRLYSDLVEQAYFFATSFFGWYLWLNAKHAKEQGNKNRRLAVTANGAAINATYIAIVIFGTAAMGYFMANIHIIFPKYFPEPASYPYLDAFTTVMSFVAQFLLTKKKLESWFLWIVVDIIGIGLYYVKGVKFISAEYLLFLIIAIKGFLEWRKELIANKYEQGIGSGKILPVSQRS